MREMTDWEHSVTDQASEYAKTLFAQDSGGHDADHSFRVFCNALAIAEQEPEADPFLISLAALLHDADDHKLFRTEDNANARAFLSRAGVPEATAEEIVKIINSVSFSRNRGRKPETPEGMIVQDADRLDAIGAVGVARTFAYGGRTGRKLTDSLEHFREKLLLLKDEMSTETARKEAERRHAFLETYLDEYYREIEWL